MPKPNNNVLSTVTPKLFAVVVTGTVASATLTARIFFFRPESSAGAYHD